MPPSSRTAPPARLGVAALTRIAYTGGDLASLREQLVADVASGRAGSGALMDLSTILQIEGDADKGMRMQRCALDINRVFRTGPPVAAVPSFRVLALAAVVDMGGNTPVDFLLGSPGIGLDILYIEPDALLPEPVPAHDVAIVIAPGGREMAADLRAIAQYAAQLPHPPLNDPARIAMLERDTLAGVLGDIAGLRMPETVRFDRATIARIAAGQGALANAFEGPLDLPIVIRPSTSQAGRGLERIGAPGALADYLEREPAPAYFVAPFVEYRSADGLYRKQRIVFIDGVPWPVHMAIGESWSLWYLNADMAGNSARRREEQVFFEDFRDGFARRHAGALKAITDRIGLDYFGIDCAETASGELLVFEADNALIVHDLDPVDIYPYKQAPMRAVFSAFQTLCIRAALRGRASPEPLRA